MPSVVVDAIAQLLVKAHILTQDQVLEVLHSEEEANDTFDKVLFRKNMVARSTLMTLLMEHYKVPFISLPEKVDIQILKLLPEHLVTAYEVLPVGFEGQQLTLAMVNPSNKAALDRLAAITGLRIKPVGMLEGDFRDFFQKYFEDTTMAQILKEIEITQKEEALQQTTIQSEAVEDRPITKLIDSMISLSIKKRASDIHIEPQDNFILIRFRIDGTLQTQQIVPKAVLTALVSRIKVLCELDITEKRIPQDGKFRHKTGNREVDVRVSTVPSRYGEKVAMRILDRRSLVMNLDMLGMPADMQSRIDLITSRPNGLLLITGPTGSGKTTSLYAIVQKMRSPRLNIMTLEDPIEYELLAGSKREGGITQIQINPKIGLTFASGLRSCLRQDPDIIFVGEIRDKETAETAISSALTGHFVLSSLHTNGAIQTVSRLLDMGVEPFMIVSAIRGIVSQRLVRVLCHHCKQAYTPPKEALDRLGLSVEDGALFYKPEGCGSCMQQGYWGRTGVFEILGVDGEVNKAILTRKSSGEIFALARERQNFRTLRQFGMDLVSQGVTSVEEVLRVLPSI
jgi:type IV pilus assembly protein PilB